ncbi:MAG: CDP-alcohol phosphatidyltransferase family protein [Candidatus Pacearchaeota archaeon]
MEESKEWSFNKVITEIRELWKDRRLIGKFTIENIPNFLTISRFIITFVIIYLILVRKNLIIVIIVFCIGALTDYFDGKLARKYHWESEFGRVADMIADRFLWVGTAIAFLFTYGIIGSLNWVIGIQLFFILTREIISAPFVLIAFPSGTALPPARYIAKLTTFLQGFALPALILSILYPFFIYISLPLSILCFITGFISALYYLRDIHAPHKSIKENEMIKDIKNIKKKVKVNIKKMK